jgi:type II secretory pathway component GspD/PulD (secretin)
MNAPRFPFPSVCGWALLGLLMGQGLLGQAQEQPPLRSAPAADKAVLRVFRLEKIAATDASQIVRALLGDQVGPKGNMRMAVDTGGNSLLLSGGGDDQARVEAILQALDKNGRGDAERRSELRQFRLKFIAAPKAARTLRELLGDELAPRGAVRMSVDEGTNSLLLWGAPSEQARVAEILRAIDVEGGAVERGRKLVEVVPLGPLAADPALDDVLRLALDGRSASFVVARGLGVVVVSGDREAVFDVARLLHSLQQAGRPPAAPAKPTAGPGKPAGGEKTFTFEFQNKPWGQVLEWLSDQSGLALVSPFKPTGTFTFVPPKGKTYTLREIIDILNEGLLASSTQKYLLIRGERTLTLVPADEKIDPGLVPRIRPDELSLRGRTEIVSVVFPLAGVKAEDVAPDVKKLLGPFGEVAALNAANQLVVQDTAANVGRVYAMLVELERRRAGTP